MIGLGTIINVAGVLIGGIIGLTIGKGLKERFQHILMAALGLSVIFMSTSGVIKEMLVIKGGNITTQGTFMMIAAMVLGAFFGEIINLEDKTEKFGEWLKKKTGSLKDTSFVDGFVAASLTTCVGAMTVIGSINDGLMGDYSILLTKSILDTVVVMVLTATYGKGCIFSVIPIALIQGLITVLATLIEPIMTEKALSNLSLVGSILIFCVGINLLFGKKVKVANLLPAIIFAVAFAFVPWFDI